MLFRFRRNVICAPWTKSKGLHSFSLLVKWFMLLYYSTGIHISPQVPSQARLGCWSTGGTTHQDPWLSRAVGCWRQGAGKVKKLMCFFTESKCQSKFSANHRMESPEVKQDSSGHGYTHIASRSSVWGLPPQPNHGGVSMAPVCHSAA